MAVSRPMLDGRDLHAAAYTQILQAESSTNHTLSQVDILPFAPGTNYTLENIIDCLLSRRTPSKRERLIRSL